MIDADVGPPEAVDGLLRVADNEELAPLEAQPGPVALLRLVRRRGEEPDDLHLERVSVLEFVDEDTVEASLGATADLRVVAQEVTRPRQQVVEGGLAFVSPRCRHRPG